jgi:hypothetical protein
MTMRSRSVIGDVRETENKLPAREDTYTRVRRAIDEALAELDQITLTDRQCDSV